jgi:putative SOS response-associated peptidase YedK
MCFHNSLAKDSKKLSQRYKAATAPEVVFEPIHHGNGFDFLLWPVIVNKGENILEQLYWGLVPSWVKSREDAIKIRAYNLNAKIETVFEKPSFKTAIKKSRCIVPSTGFFEWQTLNKKKYPYFIYPANEDFFSMAGIWEEWADKESGEITRTFSILTTEANPLMASIHNEKKRMPVLLAPNQEEEWLKGDINEHTIQPFAAPFEECLMKAHPISKLITDRARSSNIPEVTEPFHYPELWV